MTLKPFPFQIYLMLFFLKRVFHDTWDSWFAFSRKRKRVEGVGSSRIQRHLLEYLTERRRLPWRHNSISVQSSSCAHKSFFTRSSIRISLSEQHSSEVKWLCNCFCICSMLALFRREKFGRKLGPASIILFIKIGRVLDPCVVICIMDSSNFEM